MSRMFSSILVSVLFQALAPAHIEDGHTKEKDRYEHKEDIRHRNSSRSFCLSHSKQEVSTSLENRKGSNAIPERVFLLALKAKVSLPLRNQLSLDKRVGTKYLAPETRGSGARVRILWTLFSTEIALDSFYRRGKRGCARLLGGL